MNDEAVYRTAPATPGLLITSISLIWSQILISTWEFVWLSLRTVKATQMSLWVLGAWLGSSSSPSCGCGGCPGTGVNKRKGVSRYNGEWTRTQQLAPWPGGDQGEFTPSSSKLYSLCHSSRPLHTNVIHTQFARADVPEDTHWHNKYDQSQGLSGPTHFCQWRTGKWGARIGRLTESEMAHSKSNGFYWNQFLHY